LFSAPIGTAETEYAEFLLTALVIVRLAASQKEEVIM
jgi:hypothetical protein